jgi:hypothetical protein
VTQTTAELRRKYGEILRHWGLLDEVANPENAEEFAVTDLIHAMNTHARPAILRAAAEVFRAEAAETALAAAEDYDADMAREARQLAATAARLDRMADEETSR